MTTKAGEWTWLKTASEPAHTFSECGTCRTYPDRGTDGLQDLWRHPDGAHRFVVWTCLPCASDTTHEQRFDAATHDRGVVRLR